MSKQLKKQSGLERTQRSTARPMTTKRAQRSDDRPMATKRSTPDDRSATHDRKVRRLIEKHYKNCDSIPLEKRVIILCAKMAIGFYDVDLVCDDDKPWNITITERRAGGNG